MFSPRTIAACNLNPGDMIRYTNPQGLPNESYPVMQGIVTAVDTHSHQEDPTRVGTRLWVRLLLSNSVSTYWFPSDHYIDVTGQVSQEALDYMKDFRKFQP